MSLGFAIFALTTLAPVFATRAPGLIQDVLLSALLLLGTIVFTAISYRLFKRVSPEGRTSAEYLKLMAIVIGFIYPIFGVIALVQSWSPIVAFVANVVLAIPVYVYATRVQCAFWRLSAFQVIARYLFAAALSLPVIMVPLALTGYFFGYEGADPDTAAGTPDTLSDGTRLIDIADGMNRTLPFMLDAGTELTTVTVGDRALIYHVRLVAVSASEVTEEQSVQMRSRVLDNACANPDALTILRENVRLEYRFLNRDHRQIASMNVSPSDCAGGG